MLTSITAGALTGAFGSTVKRFALWMLEEDLVHSIASDAHDARRRPPGMSAALAAARGRAAGLCRTRRMADGVRAACDPRRRPDPGGSGARAEAAARPVQASRTIAMTMPTRTQTTIAACTQIQSGFTGARV